MAAFARVVTDYAVFAYLRDVFTLPPIAARVWRHGCDHHPPSGDADGLHTDAGHPRCPRLQRAGYKRVPHPEYYMSVPARPGTRWGYDFRNILGVMAPPCKLPDRIGKGLNMGYRVASIGNVHGFCRLNRRMASFT